MSAARQMQQQPAAVPMPVAELLAIVREYIDASRFDGADRLLGHLLAAAPRHPEALHLSGYVAFKRNRPEQAAALMEQALAAGANAPRQLCNLAEVYRLLGRIEDGLAAVRRAAAVAPTDPVCHFNEAMLHYERLDTLGCIRAARRAIALRPEMPEAHMRLGQTLLLTGSFPEGWAEYEWRYQIAGAQPLMPAAFVARGRRPQWDGAPLPADRRLLLVADQGFGDVMMFSRYLPWAMARAPALTVACSQELLPLIARMFPGPDYQARWDDITDYAAFCPFSGLPRLAGTEEHSIPPAVPFTPDPGRAEAMARWVAQAVPAGLKRVGLVWAGRPTHNNDRNRSVSLAAVAGIGTIPGLGFVSLQKGPAAAQRATWPGPAPMADADPVLASFEDTAALIAQLDLLICVDTSVGHLAGCLGKPAWVLVPHAPDWRWLMGRMDSPWYPSLRLYRQHAPKAWPEVLEHLMEDLTEYAAGGAAPGNAAG